MDSGFLGSGSHPAWNDWVKLIANAVGPTIIFYLLYEPVLAGTRCIACGE